MCLEILVKTRWRWLLQSYLMCCKNSVIFLVFFFSPRHHLLLHKNTFCKHTPLVHVSVNVYISVPSPRCVIRTHRSCLSQSRPHLPSSWAAQDSGAEDDFPLCPTSTRTHWSVWYACAHTEITERGQQNDSNGAGVWHRQQCAGAVSHSQASVDAVKRMRWCCRLWWSPTLAVTTFMLWIPDPR